MNLFINSRIHLIGSLIIILSLVAGGILSAASVNKQAESSSENQGSKSNQENFMLTNHMGSKVSLFDYKGKVVILLFGYTHCPDICPTQLADMQRLLEKMGDKADQVQVLFITFDPERDTPKVLKEFLTFFHPSFVGLTGTQEEIAAVAQQYNVIYIKREVGSKAGYLIGHSSFVYLLDQQGHLYKWYKQNLEDSNSTLDKMAGDIQQLIMKGSRT